MCWWSGTTPRFQRFCAHSEFPKYPRSRTPSTTASLFLPWLATRHIPSLDSPPCDIATARTSCVSAIAQNRQMSFHSVDYGAMPTFAPAIVIPLMAMLGLKQGVDYLGENLFDDRRFRQKVYRSSAAILCRVCASRSRRSRQRLAERTRYPSSLG